ALLEQGAEAVEHLAVQFELGDSVDQFAFLLAQVLAPDHRQQLVFPHTVPVTQRTAVTVCCGTGGGIVLLRSTQGHHLTGEAGMNAHQAIGVERQRPGQGGQFPRPTGCNDLHRVEVERPLHVRRDEQGVLVKALQPRRLLLLVDNFTARGVTPSSAPLGEQEEEGRQRANTGHSEQAPGHHLPPAQVQARPPHLCRLARTATRFGPPPRWPRFLGAPPGFTFVPSPLLRSEGRHVSWFPNQGGEQRATRVPESKTGLSTSFFPILCPRQGSATPCA